MDITVKNLQDYLFHHYGGRATEQGMFMKLVEEMGEVAEILNKRAGRKAAEGDDLQRELGAELADVIHYTVAIAAITLEMMDSIGATQNDTEDIANLVGALEGVKASVTIRELAPGKNKISLRPDPNWLNASTTCALLGGGGHAAASGATVEAGVEETKRVILDAIHKVKHGN